jgi:hypothetical protein
MNMTSVALTIVAVGLVSGCNGPAGRAEVNGLRAALSRSGRDDDLVLQLQWTSRSAPWLLEGIEPVEITYWSPVGTRLRSCRVFVGLPDDFRARSTPTLSIPLDTTCPLFADRVTVSLGASGLSAARSCSW